LIRPHWFPHSIKKLVPRCGSTLLLLCSLLVVFPSSALSLYIQIDGVADIKSNFSEGCSSITDIVSQAERQKIDVVLFGDFARNSIEFGVKPFERIFKDIHQGPSVLDRGVGGYISEIKDNNRKFAHTLLIPGVETIPFYFWTGSNYDKNLTAHNWDKHLLVFGMPSAQGYEQLPLPNSNFSKEYTQELLKNFIIVSFIFMLTVGAVYKGYLRIITVPLMFLFALLAVNNHPFQSSPYDPYNGDQGMKPYQNLIDFATSKGALVFWNHMEAPNEIKQKGRVSYKTDPYPKDLLLTSNYGGFQSVANFPVMQIEPGREWDNVLGEYIQGKRKKPVWGYGANNYLCEDGGTELGEIRTIFLVRQKSRTDVLDAMASGRMYAVRQTGDERISLDDFTISDALSGRQASMGEELVSNDFPELKIKVRMTNGTEKSVRLSVIRNGLEVKQETIALPYELTWRDVNFDKNDGPVFYRLKVEADPKNYLVSNPIFIRFDEIVGAQDDSVAQITTKKLNMAEPIKPKVALPQNPSTPEIEPSNEAIQNKVLPEPRPLESKNIEVASVISPTILKQPIPPVAKMPTPPIFTDPFATITRSVIAKIDGVSLKNGPGPKFPEVGKLNKGDRLALIRSTKINFNGKPWLLVDLGGRKAYVWSDLVATK